MWSCREHSQDSQNKENQEVINLDIIFQIADEVMQTTPSSCLVKAVTPETPTPKLELSFNTSNDGACEHPSPVTPVSHSVGIVTFREQEESVVTIPEYVPEDAISKVSLFSVNFIKEFSFFF